MGRNGLCHGRKVMVGGCKRYAGREAGDTTEASSVEPTAVIFAIERDVEVGGLARYREIELLRKDTNNLIGHVVERKGPER